jgi:DNA repair photolyase
VSLDKDFKKQFEPGSAPYKKRINSLKRLYNAGLKTWVSIEPYPTPNLMKGNGFRELLQILNEIKFVDNIIFGKLNYNCTSNKFPENKKYYEKCAELVEKFCQKYNINYHIKYGTKKQNNTATVKIFKEDVSLRSFQKPKQILLD